jgi:hypothetical protein
VKPTVCDQNDLTLIAHQHIDGIAQLDQWSRLAQQELHVIDH